jgi:hypothetical protein
VKWGAYTLLVPGALLIGLGFISGLLVSFAGVSGHDVEPSQKARVLAEGIAKSMNCCAFGFLLAVVAAIWIGFSAWKWGRKTPPAS